jgi:hypothetical protein
LRCSFSWTTSLSCSTSNRSLPRSTGPVAVTAGPERFGHRLRTDEQWDAPNILILRTDPELARLLDPTSEGVADAAVVSFHVPPAYTNRSEYIDAGGEVFVEHSLGLANWPAHHDALAPVAERDARRGVRP